MCDSSFQRVQTPKDKIVLIYGAVGPPIGGLIVYVFIIGYAVSNTNLTLEMVEYPFEYLVSFGFGAPLIAMLSYIFGGVQAISTGLIIRTVVGPEGRFGYLTAVVAPLIVGALFGLFISVGYLLAALQAPIGMMASLGGIGIAASIIVRFLFRRRFGKKTS